MLIKNSSRLTLSAIVLSVILSIVATGCSNQPETLAVKLGQVSEPVLSDVIRRSLDAQGGRELFEKPIVLEAQALGAIYGEDGGKVLMKQRHTIDVMNRTVVLASQDAGMEVMETLAPDQLPQMTLNGAGGSQRVTDAEELYGSKVKLILEYYAMAGVYALLDDALTVRYMARERKGGKIYHKVQAEGYLVKDRGAKPSGVKDRLLIWFDADTWLIDRILISYLDPMGEEAFKFLAVNVRNYEPLETGLVVPGYLGYVPGDEFQNYSEKYIMSVEFLEMKDVAADAGGE